MTAYKNLVIGYVSTQKMSAFLKNCPKTGLPSARRAKCPLSQALKILAAEQRIHTIRTGWRAEQYADQVALTCAPKLNIESITDCELSH